MAIYEELSKHGRRRWRKGFPYKGQIKGSYHDVQRTLVNKPGIEKLVEDLIVPMVNRQVKPRILADLRAFWRSGNCPPMKFLEARELIEHEHGVTRNRLPLFLDVNTQYRYVAGWTFFAGVWFEEIEPRHAD